MIQLLLQDKKQYRVIKDNGYEYDVEAKIVSSDKAHPILHNKWQLTEVKSGLIIQMEDIAFIYEKDIELGEVLNYTMNL